jgi:predicted phosphodiesterase
MKYLILSDIHSNLEALTAVLRRVQRKRFDRVVVLGDLVGYGADPNPIVDAVRKLKRAVIIRGNHDKVCSGLEAGEMFNKVALESARWTEKKLLRGTVSGSARFPKGQSGWMSSSRSPRHASRRRRTSSAGSKPSTCSCPHDPIAFFGHSHFPVVFGLDDQALTTYIPKPEGPNGQSFKVKLRKGTRYLINPGSIGQPRDGDNRASFGILDAERMTMTIYRVAYPYTKTQAKIRAAGLPSPLADRLALGR